MRREYLATRVLPKTRRVIDELAKLRRKTPSSIAADFLDDLVVEQQLAELTGVEPVSLGEPLAEREARP
jgi:hypothetical protein